MGIVVIGTTFVDIKGYPFDTYIPAGRNAGYIAEVHGGVCRNIAEDIANVGLRPTFVSVVDESGLSADVVARLEEHGCDTTYVRKAENGLGTWLAIFDETGDVVASISRRPDLTQIERLLNERGDEIVSDSDGVAIELDIDEPILSRVLDLAERHGKKVYVPVTNMSIAAERRDALARIECLVCNEQEAGILFGESYEGLAPEEMRATLVGKVAQAGIRSMVVTMGSQGSVFATSVGESGCCPAQKVDVVDTTGAGDAFFAGVVAGLTSGKAMAEACAIGTALSASVITTDENVCRRFGPDELGLGAAR